MSFDTSYDLVVPLPHTASVSHSLTVLPRGRNCIGVCDEKGVAARPPWAPEGTCRRVDHMQCTRKRQATPQCPNRSQIVPPPSNFVSCTPSESESTFVIATRLCFCLEGVALRDDLLLPSLVYSLSSCCRQMSEIYKSPLCRQEVSSPCCMDSMDPTGREPQLSVAPNRYTALCTKSTVRADRQTTGHRSGTG